MFFQGQYGWSIEEYHTSLKSNLALAKSPTRTTVTQTNHLFCSLFAFVKLELLRVKTTTNHLSATIMRGYKDAHAANWSTWTSTASGMGVVAP